MTDEDKIREQGRNRASRFYDRLRRKKQQEQTKKEKKKEQRRTSILQTLRNIPTKAKSLYHGEAHVSEQRPIDMGNYFGTCIYCNSITRPQDTNQETKLGVCEFCSRYNITCKEEEIYLRHFLANLVYSQGRITGKERPYVQGRKTYSFTKGQLEILEQVRQYWRCTFCKNKSIPYWISMCPKCGKVRRR